MLQSIFVVASLVRRHGLSTGRALFALLMLCSLAAARADSLFPNELDPLMGGDEWARHLSMELRVGLDSRIRLGGRARFFWGPYLSWELEGQKAFRVSGPLDGSLRFSPLRAGWGEDFFAAPFIGWAQRPTLGDRGALSVGGTIYLGLGNAWTVWMEAEFYPINTGATGALLGSLQIERSFPVGSQVASFLGLRFVEMGAAPPRTQLGEQRWDLVSGTRF